MSDHFHLFATITDSSIASEDPAYSFEEHFGLGQYTPGGSPTVRHIRILACHHPYFHSG